MKKFIKKAILAITIIITLTAGICCSINIRKNIICRTKIKAESLSASERESMKHTSRNIRMIYTYVYEGRMYAGEQYTTKEKLDEAIDNNELVVYISEKNPSVSIIDRKRDIIYLSLSEFVLGTVITIYVYLKQKADAVGICKNSHLQKKEK